MATGTRSRCPLRSVRLARGRSPSAWRGCTSAWTPSWATSSPEVVAIESPFVSRNVKAAVAVGQAQAVAMIAAASHGVPVATYAPREVKKAVTDYGGSSKEQVQGMVQALLGLSEPLEPPDKADALAVAICHIQSTQTVGIEMWE